MNTLEAIRARRAVKHYDADVKIPSEKIEALKNLIRQAPTSFNAVCRNCRANHHARCQSDGLR